MWDEKQTNEENNDERKADMFHVFFALEGEIHL